MIKLQYWDQCEFAPSFTGWDFIMCKSCRRLCKGVNHTSAERLHPIPTPRATQKALSLSVGHIGAAEAGARAAANCSETLRVAGCWRCRHTESCLHISTPCQDGRSWTAASRAWRVSIAAEVPSPIPSGDLDRRQCKSISPPPLS